MNPLERRDKREKLAFLLREKGFYVRLHAYEYLVMVRNKILCSIYVHPVANLCIINYNKITAKGNENKLNDIINAIKELAPNTEVVVNKVPK